MIISPLQNTARFTTAWIQKRPRITQVFGGNNYIYKQFGLKGHNGIDFGVPVRTPLFAPIDGWLIIKDSGKAGYGKHIKIRNGETGREVVLGHLSVADESRHGKYVYMGDHIGQTGNTGFSTGPHLHFGFRRISKGGGDVWKRPVENYDNGYKGYIDILPYMITWKGTFTTNNL